MKKSASAILITLGLLFVVSLYCLDMESHTRLFNAFMFIIGLSVLYAMFSIERATQEREERSTRGERAKILQIDVIPRLQKGISYIRNITKQTNTLNNKKRTDHNRAFKRLFPTTKNIFASYEKLLLNIDIDITVNRLDHATDLWENIVSYIKSNDFKAIFIRDEKIGNTLKKTLVQTPGKKKIQ